MKREATTAQATSKKFSLHQEPLLKAFPLLNAILWDCWWEDGKPRTLPSLKIDLTGLGVHVQVTDTEGRRSSHTDAATLHEALQQLELCCGAGGIPWRPWGPARK